MKRWSSFVATILLTLTTNLTAQVSTAITVQEIVVCTSVENRQPVGTDSVFTPDVNQLVCYTRLSGDGTQSALSHIWYYMGKEMTRIDLTMNGTSWRTWSRKNILPAWKGEWRVEVQDAAGTVLGKANFTIQ